MFFASANSTKMPFLIILIPHGSSAIRLFSCKVYNKMVDLRILWNSMTSTFFVFTELANTMKYGGGFLNNLVFTEWRHCVSQNEVWGRGYYITLFSPSDVTAFHRILWNAVTSSETLLNGYSVK